MRMLLQNVALEAKEALHHPAFPYLWLIYSAIDAYGKLWTGMGSTAFTLKHLVNSEENTSFLTV